MRFEQTSADEFLNIGGGTTWKGDAPAQIPFPCESEKDWHSTTARSPAAAKRPEAAHWHGEEPAFDTSAFDWCPGLGREFQNAAKELGTRDLVFLMLDRSGPANAIEDELRKGSLPSRLVLSSNCRSAFVVGIESAIRLLRAYGQAGGRFIADQLERSTDLHELWTLTAAKEHLDARAYRGRNLTFFAGSDFRGVEAVAAAPPGSDKRCGPRFRPTRLRKQLEEKLLSVDGSLVVWKPYYVPSLIARGKLFPQGVQMELGEPHACHANAADLWARDPDRRQLATGFALHDGVWVPHSWVIQDNTLHETTRPFDRYFGIVLEPRRALKFWFYNCRDRVFPDGQLPPDFYARYAGLLPLIQQDRERRSANRRATSHG